MMILSDEVTFHEFNPLLLLLIPSEFPVSIPVAKTSELKY